MKTIAALILALSAGAAIAQACTTFYDANTGRYCYVCKTGTGDTVVTCY